MFVAAVDEVLASFLSRLYVLHAWLAEARTRILPGGAVDEVLARLRLLVFVESEYRGVGLANGLVPGADVEWRLFGTFFELLGLTGLLLALVGLKRLQTHASLQHNPEMGLRTPVLDTEVLHPLAGAQRPVALKNRLLPEVLLLPCGWLEQNKGLR